MNLVKRQKPVFTSLIDDLFLNQDWSQINTTVPAANIIEADDHFNIELAAPGKKKSDFKIELDEGVLTISSEIETKSTEKEGSFTRKEFGYSAFKRSFNIPDTVVADKISANYKEGILTVSLPKKEEALPQPKKLISIK
ncbi:MAG: Hsp20/alpha crystallin family protein [Flavobacteriaceae bacterium]|jgi:HSP20 family protein|nr:Hsp20/alpha crystallin family protein [Flavobacteriaceae bacterium]MBT6128193.1 Hsp20/alpha crystallin family protein [Flavobacteriaceae bacterium]MDG1027689.1 Hsp20/alpha crystallin family protein [Flavobacteriaceae bacterium]MDG1940754.1 Hsp20/alpha crystallin family protein [Flavobacteriaceae bacterium]